jgi:hypothetical protein
VVRRPAAVLTSPTVAALAGTVVAIAYFLLAGELDVSQDLRAEPRLHALAGCAAIAWCATVAGMAGVALVPAVLASLGGVLLIALLAAADVGAGASGVEALAAGALGALFSAALGSRALAATLPAFVALVALTGTGEAVLDARAATGDALGLTLPGWGAAPDAGALALTEPLFCGAFVALAARLGLRPAGTGLAVFLGLAAAVALDGLPPLTAMGVAFYVANADRLRTLVRDD